MDGLDHIMMGKTTQIKDLDGNGTHSACGDLQSDRFGVF